MKRNLLVLFAICSIFAGAVTITNLTTLPDGGGVFTQYNADTINTNITRTNTNLSNINTVLGVATGAPTGTGANVLSIAPTITSAVLVTPALGTPISGVITNLTGTPTGAGVFLDTGTLNLTLTQLQTLNTVGYTILAAPGATSMYQMGGCTLNLTRGSAAFTGGGTVSIGYDTTSSPATNGTIASTVFTTFASSHAVIVLPVAVAVTATTGLANKPITMTAAGGDFASGTGATGQLDCQYRILNGVQ